MKRWLTHAVIAMYLSTLGAGVLAHTLQMGTALHPGMYYIVWDMFCGWSAYSARTHIIGESTDGRYYELAPGPWGEFKPFGHLARHHYDVLFNASHRFARNTLRHSQHDSSIARIYVVEECWPKKFNVAEAVWNRQHDEPKDIFKYYNVKSVFDGDGALIAAYPTWLSRQSMINVANNPRLKMESHRGRDFMVVAPRARVGAPLGGSDFSEPTAYGRSQLPLSGSAN